MFKKLISVILLNILFNILFCIDIDEAQFNYAERLYNSQKYAEAIKEFSNFIMKYPYSQYNNKGLYYLAKSFMMINKFKEANNYFFALDRNAKTETEKRLALFGIAESYYKMKDYRNSSKYFVLFAGKYTDSPVAPAALYYASKSYLELNDIPSAIEINNMLMNAFPNSKYFIEARDFNQKFLNTSASSVNKTSDNKLPNLEKNEIVVNNEKKFKEEIIYITNIVTTPVYITNEVKKEIELPVIDKEKRFDSNINNKENIELVEITIPKVSNVVSNVLKINTAFITNVITITNSIVMPNFITNYFFQTNIVSITNSREDIISKTNLLTNIIFLSNETVITQSVKILDTNAILIDNIKTNNKILEEEIEKYKALMELKTKLLQMKEKAIEEKKNLIYSDGEDKVE